MGFYTILQQMQVSMTVPKEIHRDVPHNFPREREAVRIDKGGQCAHTVHATYKCRQTHGTWNMPFDTVLSEDHEQQILAQRTASSFGKLDKCAIQIVLRQRIAAGVKSRCSHFSACDLRV